MDRSILGNSPPGTILFTFPFRVTDIAYLHPETDQLTQTTQILSSFYFNDLGNSTDTYTTVTKSEKDSQGNMTSESYQEERAGAYSTRTHRRRWKESRRRR